MIRRCYLSLIAESALQNTHLNYKMHFSFCNLLFQANTIIYAQCSHVDINMDMITINTTANYYYNTRKIQVKV